MNQKILAEEGRLKRYWNKVKQFKQIPTGKNNKRKLYQLVGGRMNEYKLSTGSKGKKLE